MNKFNGPANNSEFNSNNNPDRSYLGDTVEIPRIHDEDVKQPEVTDEAENEQDDTTESPCMPYQPLTEGNPYYQPETEKPKHTVRNALIGAVAVVAVAGGLCLATSGTTSAVQEPNTTPAVSEADANTKVNEVDTQSQDDQTQNPDSSVSNNIDNGAVGLESDSEYGDPLTIDQLMQDLNITDLEQTMLYDDIGEIGIYVREWMKQNGYGSVRDSGIKELDDGQYSPDILGMYHIGGYDEEGNYIGYLDDVGDSGSGAVNVYVSGSNNKFIIRTDIGSGPYMTTNRQENSDYKYESDELPTAEELGQIAMEWSISTE